MSTRRVVITGMGALSPLGLTAQENWSNVLASKSGIRPISKFDTSNFSTKIAGEIGNVSSTDFNPEDFLDPKEMKRMDEFIQYGIIASIEAIRDSGWEPQTEEQKLRTGVLIGSGIGGLKAIQDATKDLFMGAGRVSPFFIPSCLINLLSGHISIKHGYKGPNHSVVTACASGAHAIGDAARLIKYGDADVMIAGGAESPICEIGLAGFSSARALSTKYNDSPERASRPWDKDRDGFVMSEGAAIVVVEELEHAKKRGAKIYAEIIGYGLAGDAYHITSSHPEGLGGKNAMIAALKDAKIATNQVGYINAHGTSTSVGDVSELNAVQTLFQDELGKIAMSSTKSATGHLLGAAGSLEAIYTILALKEQIIPPTLNLDNPIDEVKIDLVPFKAKEGNFDYALTNSFGFGGTNTCIALKRYT